MPRSTVHMASESAQKSCLQSPGTHLTGKRKLDPQRVFVFGLDFFLFFFTPESSRTPRAPPLPQGASARRGLGTKNKKVLPPLSNGRGGYHFVQTPNKPAKTLHSSIFFFNVRGTHFRCWFSVKAASRFARVFRSPIIHKFFFGGGWNRRDGACAEFGAFAPQARRLAPSPLILDTSTCQKMQAQRLTHTHVSVRCSDISTGLTRM